MRSVLVEGLGENSVRLREWLSTEGLTTGVDVDTSARAFRDGPWKCPSEACSPEGNGWGL